MTTIPEAKQEAAKIVFEFETRVQSGEFDDPDGHQASVALEHMIEQALLAAEKRGLEEAAKIADDYSERAIKANPPAQEASAAAQNIAAAIRSTN